MTGNLERKTLRKEERICSKKHIDQLFNGGTARSMSSFPLRVVYDTVARPGSDASPQAAILISVPKRHFHHAVDRNRVKRQVREAYRQNRHLLADVLNTMPDRMLLLSFIWMADRHLPSSDVAQRL